MIEINETVIKVDNQHELRTYLLITKKLTLHVSNYGASIIDIQTPDKDDCWGSIIVNYPQATDYLKTRSFLGASVGRVAGRIKNGCWGEIQLEQNEEINHLHGGTIGFDNVFWESTMTSDASSTSIIFSKFFPDSQGGYPGNLEMTITYTVKLDGTLTITFNGISDQVTLLNPTNHVYFNLSAGMESTIYTHDLSIDSNYFLPLDTQHLPTGELYFKKYLTENQENLGSILSLNNQHILLEDGLNHPFILNKNTTSNVILSHKNSGRKVEITTSYPCAVCYTGNHFNDEKFKKHCGIAIECQNFPDVDRLRYFGTNRLAENKMYREIIHYKFY